MKKTYFILICLLVCYNTFAQVIAYPSINDSKVLGASCADLHYVNPNVIGHQNNVSIAYYFSLTDAQNETNALERFYVPVSNPQTIYARVDNNTTSNFDIEECELISEVSGGGPPPGITPCYFDVCDADGNGSEVVYLSNLQCRYSGYGFPTGTFCASSDNDIETTFYLTQSDADNETNPINKVYTLTSSQTFYRKIKNTVTNENLIDDLLNVNLVICSTDTDSDGIPDLVEDANKNLQYIDDDTDEDGLKNYEDDDDDGDGILTINEDYNNNGDPTDDDVNGNGIADYLEADVTLSFTDADSVSFDIFPNPVKNKLTVQSNSFINSISIYSFTGQLIKNYDFKTSVETKDISVKDFQEGIYILKIVSNNKTGIKKLIKY